MHEDSGAISAAARCIAHQQAVWNGRNQRQDTRSVIVLHPRYAREKVPRLAHADKVLVVQGHSCKMHSRPAALKAVDIM